MLKVFEWIVTVLSGFKWLFAFLIHIWTVVIVYSMHGVFGGIASLMLPFISEIYLVYTSWSISGTFFTKYNTIIVGYVILFVILWMAIMLLSKIEEKSPN